MATADELLTVQYTLIRVTLPSYINTEDWDRAKIWYRQILEYLKSERTKLEKMVLEAEKRVGLLAHKVAELEP